jgi:hypothetical protein
MADKEDPNLEAYKSLAALYIKVDESVMTRHRFFITILIAIITAIGYLCYQLNNCNYERTSLLINAAFWIGVVILVAWILIACRGLFIDEILSKELIDIEKELNIYPAFTNYTERLIGEKNFKELKDTEKRKPEPYEKLRMEHIQILIIFISFLGFFWFYLCIFPKLDTYIPTKKECISDSQLLTSGTCFSAEKQPQKEDKGKITNSPINNITINVPSDKDKNTKPTSSNFSDDCSPNS